MYTYHNHRLRLLLPIGVRLIVAAIVGSPSSTSMAQKFPAAGHVYIVDFGAFVVELNFESDTKLTYTGIRPDGSRGQSETVWITATYIRDNVFMVTWQEGDKTTVVHVEDYENNVIYTNITNPNNTFQKFKGTVRQIS